MRGKTNEEILSERQRAIEVATRTCGEELEVIDSFFQNAPVDASPLWFLAKSIELLSFADIACFVDGWDKARGCVIEHACATEYGIHTMYLGE